MFISNAYAEVGAAAPQGDIWSNVLFMAPVILVFYFMILRPQQKRAKEHKAMMDVLQKGDEVVTTGGMVGRVVKVYDEYASVELAENIEVKVQKIALLNVLPKGTLNAIK